MMEPLTAVTIKRLGGERFKSTIWAVIRDNRALEAQRSDNGAVPAAYKDRGVLLLRQERRARTPVSGNGRKRTAFRLRLAVGREAAAPPVTWPAARIS